jgi:hypothetical protein
VLPKVRWFGAFLAASAVVLEACTECDDCDRGPIPVAYVRVHTATSSASVPGVGVRLERNGFVPLIAATDSLGEHTFEALEAVDGEEATLTVIPPSGYGTPAPQLLSLVLSDTLDVQVDLETVP